MPQGLANPHPNLTPCHPVGSCRSLGTLWRRLSQLARCRGDRRPSERGRSRRAFEDGSAPWFRKAFGPERSREGGQRLRPPRLRAAAARPAGADRGGDAPCPPAAEPGDHARARRRRQRGRVRSLGSGGWVTASRIVSFEPLADAFAALERAATSDARCGVPAAGSGILKRHDRDPRRANAASSLLAINDRALRSAPQAGYVSTEQVEVTRLDSIWPELAREGDRVWPEARRPGIRARGTEGAEASLPSIACVQAEPRSSRSTTGHRCSSS